MMHLLRHSTRFLHGNALAIVAIVLATSGSAYAAAKITSAQIANNTIVSADVKNNALTGADIKDKSITAADLAKGVAAAGPRGADGKDGAQGPKGADGANGIMKLTATNHTTAAASPPAPNFVSALTPTGTSAAAFTTTVSGDLLLLAGGGFGSVTISANLNTSITGALALYLDGVAVPGTAANYSANGGTLISGLPVGNITGGREFKLNQAVLKNVAAGPHTLQVRYTTSNAAVTTATASIGADYTIVELG